MKRLPHGSITLQEIAEFYPALAFVAGQTLRLAPLDSETAEWVNGAAFVKWLKTHGYTSPTHSPLTETQRRQINRWEHDAAASVYEVDEILVALGLDLHDIPDELWCRRPFNSGRRPLSPRRRSQIVARFHAGEGAAVLAREFGISAQAIRLWARKG